MKSLLLTIFFKSNKTLYDCMQKYVLYFKNKRHKISSLKNFWGSLLFQMFPSFPTRGRGSDIPPVLTEQGPVEEVNSSVDSWSPMSPRWVPNWKDLTGASPRAPIPMGAGPQPIPSGAGPQPIPSGAGPRWISLPNDASPRWVPPSGAGPRAPLPVDAGPREPIPMGAGPRWEPIPMGAGPRWEPIPMGADPQPIPSGAGPRWEPIPMGADLQPIPSGAGPRWEPIPMGAGPRWDIDSDDTSADKENIFQYSVSEPTRVSAPEADDYGPQLISNVLEDLEFIVYLVPVIMVIFYFYVFILRWKL